MRSKPFIFYLSFSPCVEATFSRGPLCTLVGTVHLYTIATRSMYVCMHVCLKPISFGTDGSIYIILFLLVLSWSGEGFSQEKNVDFGSNNRKHLNFTL